MDFTRCQSVVASPPVSKVGLALDWDKKPKCVSDQYEPLCRDSVLRGAKCWVISSLPSPQRLLCNSC